LNIVDDHSRLCLGCDARPATTSGDVVASFRKAFAQWGIPAGVLTDIQSGWRGIRAKSSAGGEDRCRPAPARHRYLTDWSAQRLLAR
jgi:hypothetical protein